jgi:Protein of unknown function (DUF3768)
MNHRRTAEPAVATIAWLNDKFRSTVEGGEVLMTAAVNALPVDVRAAAIAALRASTVFTMGSDPYPYQEHDFDSFALVSETFFWKIDYYDESCTYGSNDPCDPDKTTRALTLMLAQDY